MFSTRMNHKALIEKATPGVEKHIDRAKKIQKMLAPATGTNRQRLPLGMSSLEPVDQ